jgi:hypothetical protein
VTALIIALAAAWASGPARADGDPASDVLAQQSLFLSQDAGLTAPRQEQLGALLQATTRSGYQIRVAMIASPTDLGSVTQLWEQPRNYARFLGQELALVYRGRVLVIMPRGAGLYQFNRTLSREQSALAGLPRPSPRAGLGAVALAAIRRLAAAAGHPVAIPNLTAPPTASSTDTTSWIVFAAGAVLIALAWTASLRARRPMLRPRPRGQNQ